MSIYTLALFVHVVGAIGTFTGVGVWLFAALALRRAQHVGQVRTLTSLIQPSGVLAVVSILLLGVAGFYMAITVWGEHATWIVVATISFLLLAPFGIFVIDPRLRAIGKAAAEVPEGPLPASRVAGGAHARPAGGDRDVNLHLRAPRHRLPDDEQAAAGNLYYRNDRGNGGWSDVRRGALVGNACAIAWCGDACTTPVSPRAGAGEQVPHVCLPM
jgi:hypothetical protein